MFDVPQETGAARLPEPLGFREPFEVVEVRHLTPTILELWLAPDGGALQYLAGEYVLLEDWAGTVAPRSYSIANAPRADGLISLLVTRVPGGATSGWAHSRLEVGERVAVSGPYGTFVENPTCTDPAVYLAAGSGLAPIQALAEAAIAAARRPSLRLIFSARAEADVIGRERFRSWQADHSGFSFLRTLTREHGPPPRGRIPALLPYLYDTLAGHDVFIAGAPGFVSACAAAVDALGAPRARVHTELFFADPAPWTGQPPEPAG